jgi:hypothetical protein
VVSRNRSDFGGTARGTNLGEKVNVRLVVLTPLARQVIFVIDRFYGANRLTGATVHTLIRVDVKHAVALIYTVHRAFVDAGFVLYIDARKGDYVCHLATSLLGIRDWSVFVLRKMAIKFLVRGTV